MENQEDGSDFNGGFGGGSSNFDFTPPDSEEGLDQDNQEVEGNSLEDNDLNDIENEDDINNKNIENQNLGLPDLSRN